AWIEGEDMVDIFAVVQSVPGVIAVNSATFVGYRVAGFMGALAATLGVVLPSFIIISVIALFLYNFRDYPYVKEAIKGVNIGVAALMISVVFSLGKKSIKDPFSWVLCILAFVALVFLDIGPIPVLFLSAIAGLVYSFYLSKKAIDKGRREGGQ
ncbi:MAG TPA: chromate transporter, partial [Bacillota bacterium]|nr:chromate transporter [Bacillota bacterium]